MNTRAKLITILAISTWVGNFSWVTQANGQETASVQFSVIIKESDPVDRIQREIEDATLTVNVWSKPSERILHKEFKTPEEIQFRIRPINNPILILISDSSKELLPICFDNYSTTQGDVEIPGLMTRFERQQLAADGSDSEQKVDDYIERIIPLLPKDSSERKDLEVWVKSIKNKSRPLSRTPVPELNNDDVQRIRSCLQIVTKAKLKDGSLRLVPYFRNDEPCDIDPYFANMACLGLLAAHHHSLVSEDVVSKREGLKFLKIVEDWIDWYSQHLHDGSVPGAIEIYQGRYNSRTDAIKVDPYRPKFKTPDSHDSYAATFLTIVRYWVEAKGDSLETLNPKTQQAVRDAIGVVERCRDADGVCWNFIMDSVPNGKVPGKYLMDNVEVYQGLVSAAKLLRSKHFKDEQRAMHVEQMAVQLGVMLNRFRSADRQRYHGLYGDKLAGVPFGKQGRPVDALANLMVMAHFAEVPERQRVWDLVSEKFQPDCQDANPPYPAEAPIERWVLAAKRLKSEEIQNKSLMLLRDRADQLIEQHKLLNNPKTVASKQAGIHRYAFMVLALLDPVLRLPDVPGPAD